MYYNILIFIHHAYEPARNNSSSAVTHILYNKIETTSKMIFKNVSVQNKYNWNHKLLNFKLKLWKQEDKLNIFDGFIIYWISILNVPKYYLWLSYMF